MKQLAICVLLAVAAGCDHPAKPVSSGDTPKISPQTRPTRQKTKQERVIELNRRQMEIVLSGEQTTKQVAELGRIREERLRLTTESED